MTPAASVTVNPRPWDHLDAVARFLVSATALIDRLAENGAGLAVDGTLIRVDAGTEAAVTELCRALRLPMTPDRADIAWARGQLVASGWSREAVSDSLLLWIEDSGHEAVIV